MWLSWLECSPRNLKLVGSIPGVAVGAHKGGDQSMFLPHIDVPLPYSLKAMKKISSVRIKNKHNSGVFLCLTIPAPTTLQWILTAAS